MPTIKLACPHCHTPLAIAEGAEPGKRLRCSACKTVFAVPGKARLGQVPTLAHTRPGSEVDSLAAPESITAGTVPPTGPSATGADPHLGLPSIPGYDLLGELGRGGMGVVYKAHQKALKRLVALKMILAGVHANPQAFARFQAEAEALARLRHAHIVQIHEIGAYEGQPFFSLEFLEGGNLKGKLAGNPLPPRESAILLEKLAWAVHAAHAQGIVHRDLKPANVLLTREGEPKITDFGLAKQLDLNFDLGQTRIGAIMGTPNYMAPEQALGETDKIGPGADIYSLGVMLYEFLTGGTPFKGATPTDTLMQLVSDEPVPPSRLQPKIPLDLETICLKCLRKDAGQRYATAAALAEEVRRYLDGMPIQARPASAWERTRKWARRRPALASLVAVLFLGALTLLGGGLYFTSEIAGERNKAVAERNEADLQRDLAKEREEDARLQFVRAEKERGRAEQHEKEVQKQLERVRHALFSGQLAQVSTLWKTDPGLGLNLLLDGQSCPPQLRDFSWHYYHRLCLGERGVFPANVFKNKRIRIAFSPDGKLMAAGLGTGYGLVRVWDVNDHKLLHECKGHQGGAGPVVFARDGKTLFSGGLSDKTIRQWDVATGKEIKILATMAVPVRGLALHPEGKWLAACGHLDNLKNAKGEIVLWNVESGEKKPFLEGYAAGVSSMVFSPDGALLAAATTLNERYKIWQTATGKHADMLGIGSIYEFHDDSQAVAFSHDGKFLAIGGGANEISLFNVAENKWVSPTFVGHQLGVSFVQFSRDDKQLLSGAKDGTVRLWDVASRREVLTLRDCQPSPVAFAPDGQGILCRRGSEILHLALPGRPEYRTLAHELGGSVDLAFSPDGKHLASTGPVGTGLLWNPHTGASQSMAKDVKGAIHRVAFAADSQSIFLAAQVSRENKKVFSSIVRWDLKTQQSTTLLGYDPTNITVLAASPRHPWLIAGNMDGVLSWWDLNTRKELDPFTHDQKPVRALAFHPTEKMLAGHVGDAFVLWNMAQAPPKVMRTQKAGKEFVFAFSPDGQTLALKNGRFMDVVDTTTGELKHTIGPANADILAAAFCPDRTTLALGLYDRTVQLWNVPFQQARAILPGHLREVTKLAFSPDGTMLATGGIESRSLLASNSAEIKLWSGAALQRPIGHGQPPPNSGFSADATKFSSRGKDNSNIIWDCATGKEQTAWVSLAMGSTPQTAASLTPNGKKHFSLFEDGTVVVVDAQTGKELSVVKSDRSYLPPMQFSENNLVLLDGSDNSLRLLNLETYREIGALPVPGKLKKGHWHMSADRHWLVQLGEDFTIEAFNLKKGTRTELSGHTKAVMALRCLPGNRAVSAGMDRTVIVWDLASGTMLQRLEGHSGPTLGLAISPSGKLMVSVGPRGKAKDAEALERPELEFRVWNLNTLKEQRPPIFLPYEGGAAMAISPQDELAVAHNHRNGFKFYPRIKLVEK